MSKPVPLRGEDKTLMSYDFFVLRESTSERKKFLVNTVCGVVERVFIPAVVRPERPEKVWVDEVTGTCYRLTGECLTSNTRTLVLEGVEDGD